MQLPTQLVKLRFEQGWIDRQLLRPAEKPEIVGAGRQRLNLAARRAEMLSCHGSLAAPAVCADDRLCLGFRHTHASSLAAGCWPSNQPRFAIPKDERTAARRNS